MPHFGETVLQQKGTVDAATERDANMGYQLLVQLNDQLCNKKVIDHVSEWRVGVTWPGHALPAGKLLTLLTIVPQGSEYRIAQVYGGDSVNQLLLDEHTKMFDDEQVGLPPVEHWRMLYGQNVDSVLVVDDAVVRRHYSEHRTTITQRAPVQTGALCSAFYQCDTRFMVLQEHANLRRNGTC